MATSYKLFGDGNYIDSTGIAHKQVPLNEVLDSLNITAFYKKFESMYTTTADVESIIPIGIDEFNETCILFVDVNGIDRVEGVDYTINYENNTIILLSALDAPGQEVHFVVLKTVATTSENYDYLKGENGQGVVAGGTRGQVLLKNSDYDYDTIWGDAPVAIDIIDNLTSTNSQAALSANQGRVLNNRLTTLEEDPLAGAIILYDVELTASKIEKLLNAITTDEELGENVITSPIYYEYITTNASGVMHIYIPLVAVMDLESDNMFGFTFDTGDMGNRAYTASLVISKSGGSNFVSKTAGERNSYVDNLTSTSATQALTANQGKILNDKIAALEARLAAIESGEINVAIDPTDTSDMNLWIATS